MNGLIWSYLLVRTGSHHRYVYTGWSDVQVIDYLTDEIQRMFEIRSADASRIVKHEYKVLYTR